MKLVFQLDFLGTDGSKSTVASDVFAFQGDQKGAPMYIQLQHYPGTVVLYTGIHHLVG